MDIISSGSCSPNSNWVSEDRHVVSSWTPEENKRFENALAVYDTETSDRWHKIAAMIPGKTVHDVIKHYKDLEDDVSDIEAGLIPVPGYRTSFTLEWVNNSAFDGLKHPCGPPGKRSNLRPEQERKKGVPWTEDEHRLFLMGLKKYGKGDWRNISRNFVVSRTPTQVASHAQKYFIRQCSGGKDKRRSSIHDITTVNLGDIGKHLSPSRSPKPPTSATMASAPKKEDHFSILYDLDQPNQVTRSFTPTAIQTCGQFLAQPYGGTSYRGQMQARDSSRGNIHESSFCPHSAALLHYPLQHLPQG